MSADDRPAGVLDLVHAYADDYASYAMTGEQRFAEAAALTLDRIAALVPQQPVQARDEFGIPLFIHTCGTVMPESVSGVATGEHYVYPPCKVPGPWRPLLVGGDPAPERKLIGPPHAHLDAPCTDACYEAGLPAQTGGNVHRASIELAALRGLLNRPLLQLEPGHIMRTLRAAQDLLLAALQDGAA